MIWKSPAAPPPPPYGCFVFGLARTPAIARTLAWCERAALVSIGRSLPASSIFMPLPM